MKSIKYSTKEHFVLVIDHDLLENFLAIENL